jgi:S1-C subfamily serine protease
MGQILEFGEVRRGLLGVQIQDFTTETAEALGSSATEGALVMAVESGSAAENAGIEVEDIIVMVEDEEISNSTELRNAIGLRRSGDKVKITLLRDGKRRQIQAILDEAGTAITSDPAEIHPGLEGTQLRDYDGDSGVFSGPGILVANVAQDSPAARNRLAPNDVITHVNRVRVRSLSELAQVAEDARLLVLAIRRDDRAILLQVR